MKHARRILTSGCIYTTAITLLIFAAAALIKNAEGIKENAAIGGGQFLLIMLFSFLIAGADTLLFLPSLRLPIRILLHYAVTLTGFLVVFSVAGNLKLDTGARIFVSVVLFSFFYAAVMAAVLSLAHALGKLGKPKAAPKPYRSMFR